MIRSKIRRLDALVLLSVSVYVTQSIAVDGIAVSRKVKWHEWPPSRWGGDIIRYDIRNDDVVGEKVLFQGYGRCAAINVRGSHVAFFRSTESGDYVSVVSVNGGMANDLVKIPYANGHKGYLDWPAGDWIYYNMGPEKSEGSKHLRRVKYNDPASDEKVIDFNAAIWQWGMSADAKRMVLVVSDGDNYGVTTYTLPGNGLIQGHGGCGGYISPSGLYGTNLTDSEHASLGLWWFDRSGSDFGVSSRRINDWAVNASAFTTTCSGCGGSVSVGVGMDQNRWSCNSDKWVCICIGWPGGNCGRFGSCGMNQVLVNWKDQKTILVSKNPRSCDDDNGGKYDDCSLHTRGAFAKNEAGDFWVSGPAEDINPELRTYVTTSVRGGLTARQSDGLVAVEAGGGRWSVRCGGGVGIVSARIIDSHGRSRDAESTGGARAVFDGRGVAWGVYLLDARLSDGRIWQERVRLVD